MQITRKSSKQCLRAGNAKRLARSSTQAECRRRKQEEIFALKRGYSALLYSTIRAVPVVVIVMHMSKIAVGLASCFCSCVVSILLPRSFVGKSIQEMDAQDHDQQTNSDDEK